MSIHRDGVSHFLVTEPIHLAVQFSLFPTQNSRTPQYSLGDPKFFSMRLEDCEPPIVSREDESIETPIPKKK